jgi:hypothetical protein
LDKRSDQRFPLAMKAFPLGSARDEVLETDNVSASGAYFVGDPGVPAGASMWMRVELGTAQRGRESVYPLCIEVRVARLSRSGDGSIAGFGAEWRSVWCADDATPLKEFLRRTLSLSAGYIETLPADGADGRRSFLYVFPAGAAPVVEGATPWEQQAALDAAPPPVPAAAADVADLLADGVELEDKTPLPVDGRAGLSVYTAVPLTWSVDENEWEGRAVKLTPTGLRIATSAALPGAYRRLTVRIPIRQRDKSGTLALTGTVVTQRAPREDGQESQIEVQLTLGNDPDSLHLYRKLLDRLSAMTAPVGA